MWYVAVDGICLELDLVLTRLELLPYLNPNAAECALTIPCLFYSDDKLIRIITTLKYELLESLVAEATWSLIEGINYLNYFNSVMLHLSYSCVLRRRREAKP